MPSLIRPVALIRFGDFEVDLQAGRLRKSGLRIRLPDQSFQILAILVQRPGVPVTRDELRQRLWPDRVFVDYDANLNTAVARLREVLNDSAHQPRFIETLPKRGYRFLADVTESPSRRPRLLVFPFDNLSPEPGQDYFSDAMTEEIIGRLANLDPERLSVLARTTAMHFRGREKNLTRIGRELAVDYFVEGSVSRSGDRVEMCVHLIRAGDHGCLRTKRYDCALGELFNIVNAAANEIASSIGVAVGQLPGRPTQDLEAYNLYLLGRHHAAKVTSEGFGKAQSYFSQAIAKDPGFALAYDSLAELHYYLGLTGFVPPRETLSTGLFYALRAIEIDNSLAETHALLGHFRKQLDYDWAEVSREMKLAMELNPASPLVRLRYAMNGLMPHGLVKEAIVEIETALQSDPLSFHARFWLSAMCWLCRDYDRGLEEGRRLLEMAPDSYTPYFAIGHNYAGKGLYAEAVAAFETGMQVAGGAPLLLGWPAIFLGRMGRFDAARQMFDRIRTTAQQSYVPPTAFAWTHLGLGEIDRFFQAMNQAVDARDHMLTGIKSYWFLDEIRGDDRYRALLSRMNLAP